MKTLVGLAAAALLLAGCSKLIDPEGEAVAKTAYGDLQKGNFAAIEAKMTPNLRGPAIHNVFGEMKKVVPDDVVEGKLAGFNAKVAAGEGHTLELTHTYSHQIAVVTAETVLHRDKKEDPWQISGFHVEGKAK